MTLALHLRPDIQVTLMSKASLMSGSTRWAQGGVAAVFDELDSIDQHVQDTLVAGDGLCDEVSVRKTVEDSTEAMEWLIGLGMPFDQMPDRHGNASYHLTREGGHSRRRILHAADATGKAISNTLLSASVKSPNLRLLDHHIAIDLIIDRRGDQPVCRGAYILNLTTHEVICFTASFTVLATGGASKVYLYSSNPEGASGDGIALAWRAGCQVANLEFNQFHPTCLYHPQEGSFLITEAMRGEGAYLELDSGYRFMADHDPQMELAPRDVVARAIDYEMKTRGLRHVWLNITHKSPGFVMQHFPNVHKRCLKLGLDITRDRIPVVPAAHYTCGGVLTDLDGQTTVDCLYAIGETACTGLHGANRMASNSLLECMAYGRFAAAKISSSTLLDPNHFDVIPEWDESHVTPSKEAVMLEHNWEEVRRVMWDYVGIVRSNKRLHRALKRIRILQDEVEDYYQRHPISRDLIELRNLTQVARLIIDSALTRKESRGLHYTVDYPKKSSAAENTVLTPNPCEQVTTPATDASAPH
jgi:L-aspartate oxidase